MEYITLNNSIRMPQEGFGEFQVRDKEECKRSVLDAMKETDCIEEDHHGILQAE